MFFYDAQLHVLGHSLYYLLNGLSPILQPGDLDPCLAMLNVVLVADSAWQGLVLIIMNLSSPLSPCRLSCRICLGVQQRREK